MGLPRDRRGRILPPPTHKQTEGNRPANVVREERKDVAALRARLTRFARKHGPDALVSFLKLELAEHGEDRARLDKLAPKFERSGQMSILDAGR